MNCSTDNDRKQQALYYASLDWAVFPVHGTKNGRCTCGNAECPDEGKHPRSKHGFKDATTHEAKIRSWWSKWPEANIGIATGAVSGIVVIDVDPAHGGNDSLEAAKKSLGPLSAGPVARTGGGGRHLVVAYPGRRIPSRRGLAPGIDIRGDGGYIVAPRSVHASGETYEWEIPPDKLSAPQLPETWLEWMRASRTHSKGCLHRQRRPHRQFRTLQDSAGHPPRRRTSRER